MARFARPQAVATTSRPGDRQPRRLAVGDGYKWVALSNTVLAALIVTIDSTIVLIGLPAIFRGDPASIRWPPATRSTCCG